MSELEPWQFSNEGLLQGIRLAKEGGRVQSDEGTTEEQRFLRLLRTVERQGYEAGVLKVRSAIRQALGIHP